MQGGERGPPPSPAHSHSPLPLKCHPPAVVDSKAPPPHHSPSHHPLAASPLTPPHPGASRPLAPPTTTRPPTPPLTRPPPHHSPSHIQVHHIPQGPETRQAVQYVQGEAHRSGDGGGGGVSLCEGGGDGGYGGGGGAQRLCAPCPACARGCVQQHVQGGRISVRRCVCARDSIWRFNVAVYHSPEGVQTGLVPDFLPTHPPTHTHLAVALQLHARALRRL